MTWQSNSISPTSTSPSTDIGKIKNDLAQLKAVLGGGADGDIPVALKLKNSADSNPLVLDWYEEGTFTPTLISMGTPTFVDRTGYYTRIGKTVNFFIRIVWTGGDAVAVSSVGLPFAGASTDSQPVGVSLGTSGTLTFSGSPYAYVLGDRVYARTAISGAAHGYISNNTTGAVNTINFSGSYQVV